MNSIAKLLIMTTLLTGPANLAWAQSDAGARLAHTMSIEGSGEYWVAPEVAEFSGQVITKGDTLAEARDQHPAVSSKVRATIDALSQRGLKLDSARYSVSETYPFRYSKAPNLTQAEKEKSVFEATTSFQLSTENLNDLADIISSLAAGDLRISNIHFTVKNERGPLLEARKDAARDALSQANAYAGALGINLVEIRSITDGDATPPDYGQADLMVGMSSDDKPEITIAVPDQLSYRASVTVDWTIASPPLTP